MSKCATYRRVEINREKDRIVQENSAVSMNERVGITLGEEDGEDSNINVNTFFNMVSRHELEILTELLKTRLYDLSCSQCLRRCRIYVAACAFLRERNTLYLKDYLEEEKRIHDRTNVQNKVQRLFFREQYSSSKRM